MVNRGCRLHGCAPGCLAPQQLASQPDSTKSAIPIRPAKSPRRITQAPDGSRNRITRLDGGAVVHAIIQPRSSLSLHAWGTLWTSNAAGGPSLAQGSRVALR